MGRTIRCRLVRLIQLQNSYSSFEKDDLDLVSYNTLLRCAKTDILHWPVHNIDAISYANSRTCLSIVFLAGLQLGGLFLFGSVMFLTHGYQKKARSNTCSRGDSLNFPKTRTGFVLGE